ncbi:MAG: glycosyltransferase [Chloroflexi bacterium]|nr:glycosyltransferase [Chloroflexota bacterium]
MKVLFVYKDYYPVLGGIENHVRLLAEGLADEGVSVHVLVTNTQPRTVIETRNSVTITKAARLGTISSAPLSLELLRLIGQYAPDIAHLHSPYPIGEIAQLMRGNARRLVVTYHSDVVRQKYLLLLHKPFLRTLLKRAHAISISNPTYTKRSPFIIPHAAKCNVIHHGADLTRFTLTPDSLARAQRIRDEFGAPLVLFVGKFRYYKGVEYLIEAMRDVPARALIVGSGPMETVWQAKAQALGMTDHVRFLGSVPDQDLPTYYQAADLFVLPSTLPSETWGAVQIEAMASGLPCICTELGTGTSYVNQHGITGLVVPPRDSRALSCAIVQLLSDEALRRQMGAAARTRALREFTHTAMIEQTLNLYQRLLAGDAAQSRNDRPMS